jgi:hypothetical protein
MPLLLVAACASKGGEGARGQGGKEVVVPPAPEGTAWRTARGAGWKEVLEDLAEADVVFVAADGGMRVAVLEYLFARGKDLQERGNGLHAIGLETFPRTAQSSLDDFSFGRIDLAELERRCGEIQDADRPALAFAAEKRLPVLGLGLERGIADAIEHGPEGSPLDALPEEQRRTLPAVSREAGPGGGPVAAFLGRLEMDVAVDSVVRWYRDAAPEGAQVAILAARDHVAPRERLPERLFARTGKRYRTLVALPGAAAAADGGAFAKSYADYVWFTGDRQ